MKYLVVLLSLLFSTAVCAQQKWSLISKFSVGSQYYLYPVPYFVNEQYGFVLLESSDSTPLYRTIDGGKSWKKMNLSVLDLGDQNFYFTPVFTNLLFDTPGHLYAYSGNPGLFESNDSGMTWREISSWNVELNFYYVNGVLYTNNGYYSYDNAKTWKLDYAPFWRGA